MKKKAINFMEDESNKWYLKTLMEKRKRMPHVIQPATFHHISFVFNWERNI
jgi:hypothetical protein